MRCTDFVRFSRNPYSASRDVIFFDCPASTDLWNSRVAAYNKERARVAVDFFAYVSPYFGQRQLSGKLEAVSHENADSARVKSFYTRVPEMYLFGSEMDGCGTQLEPQKLRGSKKNCPYEQQTSDIAIAISRVSIKHIFR